MPIDKKEIDFSFSEELTTTATGTPLNTSAIQKVAAEQLISIKAKAVSLSGTKVQSTRYGQHKKQDVVLADPVVLLAV